MKKSLKKAWQFNLILGAIVLHCTSWNALAKNTSPISLFQTDSVLNLDISSNFDQIFKDRKFEFPEQRTAQRASILHDNNGNKQNILVKMRARGWDRLNTCAFPPLKIEFINEESKLGTAFEGAKTLKIVTQCDTKKKQRWLLREYYVYKMYQLMTPLSLKVRPVWVSYRNRAEGDLQNTSVPPFATHLGFILENMSQMAKRNGMKKVEIPPKQGLDWKTVDHDLYLKIQLFQYMIYNFDYGVFFNDMRNIDLFKDQSGKLYPVTYDFDFSEFVRDANIGHALYLQNKNFCYRWNEIAAIWPSFRDLEGPFKAVVQGGNWLSSVEKNQLLTSLTNFFEMYQNGSLKSMVEKSWKKNKCN